MSMKVHTLAWFVFSFSEPKTTYRILGSGGMMLRKGKMVALESIGGSAADVSPTKVDRLDPSSLIHLSPSLWEQLSLC
ncbi:hypothetical protein EV421DRAFT_1914708 [Armillaria borealis]|uniref:Uncharacterized protein n=1 Tax=Armillaria borealis TaxID=47425 RepID=A0AA39M662_9AGAR|nr:hypothetical protein EV421DRAFT_1914708 [Armillaria borealis]